MYFMIILCLCTALYSSFLSVCGGSRPSMCSSHFRYHRTFSGDQCQTNSAVASLSSPRARTHTSFPGREGSLCAQSCIYRCFIAAHKRGPVFRSPSRAPISHSCLSCSWVFAFATALSYLICEPWTMIVSSGIL